MFQSIALNHALLGYEMSTECGDRLHKTVILIPYQPSPGAVIHFLSTQWEQNQFKFHNNVRSHVEKLELTHAVFMKTWLTDTVFLHKLDLTCASDIALLLGDWGSWHLPSWPIL